MVLKKQIFKVTNACHYNAIHIPLEKKAQWLFLQTNFNSLPSELECAEFVEIDPVSLNDEQNVKKLIGQKSSPELSA